MKKLFALIAALCVFACSDVESSQPKSDAVIDIIPPQLSLDQARRLISLPVNCINVEYPNKLNDVLGSDKDLISPRAKHPAFYGCFDWHSAVHGHWSLVTLLKQYPELDSNSSIKKNLLKNISAENMRIELEFFNDPNNRSWERTYGWAWYLVLYGEVATWDDPVAKTLAENLTPLKDLLIERYIEFLPKLLYPIRSGEHPNSAFGMNFAWEYTEMVGDTSFQGHLRKAALAYYSDDVSCPIEYEPSGFDFLSPCLEEAALMKKVLPKKEFLAWLKQFLPQLLEQNFSIDIGLVSDRQDGKLVHLDGVNFSRAWCLADLAKDFPELSHLEALAAEHINASLPNIVGDSYEGGHWLGSFAIYALNSMGKLQ